MSKEIGAKLKQLRRDRFLTQEDVAKKLDYSISRSTLSNYEIGRRTPHLKDLRNLANLFGVSLEFFDISDKDEAFDLLSRAKQVFDDPNISTTEKEALYHEFMKLYLQLKEQERNE